MYRPLAIAKSLTRTDTLKFLTCAVGANTATFLTPQLYDIAVGVVRECIEGQILQSLPLMSGLNDGLGTESFQTQVAVTVTSSALIAILPWLGARLWSICNARLCGDLELV
jgi:hypothetical protein